MADPLDAAGGGANLFLVPNSLPASTSSESSLQVLESSLPQDDKHGLGNRVVFAGDGENREGTPDTDEIKNIDFLTNTTRALSLQEEGLRWKFKVDRSLDSSIDNKYDLVSSGSDSPSISVAIDIVNGWETNLHERLSALQPGAIFQIQNVAATFVSYNQRSQELKANASRSPLLEDRYIVVNLGASDTYSFRPNSGVNITFNG
ncbi:hypothetical protein HC248_01303 [Polaromonas vacuolata]|uniref:Uncharacterized protein n=2 Tax=Polaromonas vacuolata TaxID=37448 RepID=A0A6H2H819_9BURK|nr:hypothetical protein HC248_01303 [Polaromonas vacuolata]